MKSIFIALAVAMALSGCTSIDAGRVLLGTAQISQTSSVRDTLLDYLPSDSEERIARDLEYLDRVYLQFKNVEPDLSVVTLALEFPDAFDRVGEAFAAIRGEVLAYNQASNIAIPIDLVAYSAGTVPAYAEIRAAIESNDKAVEIIEVVRLLKPLIALVAL
ncbi:hypothetical protein [uncultured Paraglaciecola sp.]|uniref:hypothetical protein n=1 Tax=uncultured Paraglaciecola sp. TaxID=1765024 RepID=UPI002637F5F9|nr:hypothetical protein [uncultured Paraglaciecola sp.]